MKFDLKEDLSDWNRTAVFIRTNTFIRFLLNLFRLNILDLRISFEF